MDIFGMDADRVFVFLSVIVFKSIVSGGSFSGFKFFVFWFYSVSVRFGLGVCEF